MHQLNHLCLDRLLLHPKQALIASSLVHVSPGIQLLRHVQPRGNDIFPQLILCRQWPNVIGEKIQVLVQVRFTAIQSSVSCAVS